jgi:hypothetical protein
MVSKKIMEHLEDITFANGSVDHWSFGNDELVLNITDQQSNHIVLRFRGGLVVSEKGSVCSDITGSCLGKSDGQQALCLLGEDEKVVFLVNFRDCEIAVL